MLTLLYGSRRKEFRLVLGSSVSMMLQPFFHIRRLNPTLIRKLRILLIRSRDRPKLMLLYPFSLRRRSHFLLLIRVKKLEDGHKMSLATPTPKIS